MASHRVGDLCVGVLAARVLVSGLCNEDDVGSSLGGIWPSLILFCFCSSPCLHPAMGDMKTPDFDDLLAAFDIPDPTSLDAKEAIQTPSEENESPLKPPGLCVD